MLDFDNDCVEMKLDGKVVKLSLPSNGRIKQYQSDLSKSEVEKHEDLLVEFLESLGLPNGAYFKLSPQQTKKLLRALHSDEKN